VLLMLVCAAFAGIDASQHGGTFSEAAVGYIVAATIVAGAGMMIHRRIDGQAIIKPWLILSLAATVAISATCGTLAVAFDPSARPAPRTLATVPAANPNR
jgi:hypothetical protein